MITEDELKHRFTYHAPHGTQPDRYVKLRESALAHGKLILEYTQNSREQSLAITALEESTFWSNAAIARNE